MALFKVNDKKLVSIKEKRIDLERNVQNITEANLDTIFGLEFISTEFPLHGLRIDTLAFNPETKAFVIIEYKKDRNFSVVDQGVSYLALLANNKAEFVLHYNKVSNKAFGKDDFDWSQSKVIFISPSYTTYQKGATNLRDFPIEIWELKLYDNDTIGFTEIKPSETSDSFKNITINRNDNSLVSTIKKEFKTYTVEEHFKPGWDKPRELYDMLSERLLRIDPNLTIVPVKDYMAFKLDKSNIFSVAARKTKLYITYGRTKPEDLKDPQRKSFYVPNSFKYYNQHLTNLAIENEEDIEYAVFLAKQVYERYIK